jgi:hypothetical protein
VELPREGDYAGVPVVRRYVRGCGLDELCGGACVPKAEGAVR